MTEAEFHKLAEVIREHLVTLRMLDGVTIIENVANQDALLPYRIPMMLRWTTWKNSVSGYPFATITLLGNRMLDGPGAGARLTMQGAALLREMFVIQPEPPKVTITLPEFEKLWDYSRYRDSVAMDGGELDALRKRVDAQLSEASP